MPSPAQSVRLSLPRWLWLVGAVAYLPVLALLVVLVVQLQDARETTTGRLAVSVDRLRDATLPLAAAVRPAAEAATEDRPAATKLTARTLALTDQVTPLARQLRAAGAGRQLQLAGTLAADLSARGAGTQLQKAGALSDNLLGANAGLQIRRSGQLATTLLGNDVGGTLRDVRTLTSLLRSSDLPATTKALTETTDELNRGTRLSRLMQRLTAVLGQATTTRLVPRTSAAAQAVTGRIVPLIERGIAMLTETLAVTKETLSVTKDTGRHAASLDRKLGGELPAP